MAFELLNAKFKGLRCADSSVEGCQCAVEVGSFSEQHLGGCRRGWKEAVGVNDCFTSYSFNLFSLLVGDFQPL